MTTPFSLVLWCYNILTFFKKKKTMNTQYLLQKARRAGRPKRTTLFSSPLLPFRHLHSFRARGVQKCEDPWRDFWWKARAANQKTTGSLSGALRTRVDLFHPWPCQRVVLLNFASSKLCKMKDPSVAVALLRGIPLSAVLSRGSKLFQNSKGSGETPTCHIAARREGPHASSRTAHHPYLRPAP